MKRVRFGLVGSQFISTIHAEALGSVPGAELSTSTSWTLSDEFPSTVVFRPGVEPGLK